MKKEEYQEFLLKYIQRGKYRVDVKNPDRVVLLEISNDLFCISVVEGYHQNKCFNLMELASSNNQKPKKEIKKSEEPQGSSIPSKSEGVLQNQVEPNKASSGQETINPPTEVEEKKEEGNLKENDDDDEDENEDGIQLI